MSQNNLHSFLGTGWAFPPSFDMDSRGVELVSNELDIKQSLDILLSTSLGERVMQPLYGCNLNDYLFEALNASLIGFISDLIRNAILYFEPRIVVERIDITPADSADLLEGRITIEVDYSVPGTNSRYNYVYDYYLTEANASVVGLNMPMITAIKEGIKENR